MLDGVLDSDWISKFRFPPLNLANIPSFPPGVVLDMFKAGNGVGLSIHTVNLINDAIIVYAKLDGLLACKGKRYTYYFGVKDVKWNADTTKQSMAAADASAAFASTAINNGASSNIATVTATATADASAKPTK